MLNKEMVEILSASKEQGWVLEPEAKRLFSLAGLAVPRFLWTKRLEEATVYAKEIGFPVVGKIVSPKVIHKADRNGVIVGIQNEKELTEAFGRLSQIEGFSGILVEEMVPGRELIVGAKVDDQFGPVILLGAGGTGVEIYRDISLRMAPLSQKDMEQMIQCLKARPLLEGYRGPDPICRPGLMRLLETFSSLFVELAGFVASIDLNPVICSSSRCVIADARIILNPQGGKENPIG